MRRATVAYAAVRPLLLDAGLLVGGLALLTFAADRFVLGAVRLASALRVSPVLIGALVIGFGTSAPEFVVTILATLAGSQDLAYGNVIGSNTTNVLLVLGAAGLVSPLQVRFTTLRRELPLMLAAVALLTVVAFDARVSTLDALLLLGGTVLALGVIVRTARRDRAAALALATEVATYEGGTHARLGSAAGLALAGLVGTLVGAQLVIEGAVGIAAAAGLSEAVIGFTLVAVGTSLPELVTAVAAARRAEPELVVGNVLGSNIFNALPVAGVAGLLDTVMLDPSFRTGLAFMVGSCVLAAVFLRTGARIARGEAGLLLGLFLAAMAYTIVAG